MWADRWRTTGHRLSCRRVQLPEALNCQPMSDVAAGAPDQQAAGPLGPRPQILSAGRRAHMQKET